MEVCSATGGNAIKSFFHISNIQFLFGIAKLIDGKKAPSSLKSCNPYVNNSRGNWHIKQYPIFSVSVHTFRGK